MLEYKHRANSYEDVLNYNSIEIDVKSNTNTIVVGHDWNENICSLEQLLSFCSENHNLAINIKESGIIDEIDKIINKFKVNSYFYFDLPFPDLIQYSKKYSDHLAIRISEYEPIFIYDKIKYEWIWLDITDKHEFYDQNLHFNNKKVVIVSPELHNSNYIFKNLIEGAYGICTDKI